MVARKARASVFAHSHSAKFGSKKTPAIGWAQATILLCHGSLLSAEQGGLTH